MGVCHFRSSSQIPPLPPDRRAPTGHRGEGRRVRSGSPVAWSQSRQPRHRLLIQVPGRSEPHAQPPLLTPRICIYNLHRAALTHPCVRTHVHRRASSPTPDTRRDLVPLARSTPTPAGRARVLHSPRPSTHPHEAPTRAHDRLHTPKAASRHPHPQGPHARPRTKCQLCHSPGAWPWANPDPL